MKLPKINWNDLSNNIFMYSCMAPVYAGLIDAGWYVFTSQTLINKSWDWYSATLVLVFLFLSIATATYLKNQKEKTQ